MSKSLIALWIGMFLIWAVVMPLGFVTLYSAIEMQGAARSAAKVDGRLATLRTIDLVRQLGAATANGDRLTTLTAAHRTALINLFQARAEARSSAIDLLIEHGVTGTTDLCTAPPADLKACQIDENLGACTSDWLKISGCYEQAVVHARGTPGDTAAIAALHAKMQDARRQGFAFNQIAERAKTAEALEADPLRAVAEAYRDLNLPFIQTLFKLPQGVVVAIFTSLMAAMGAGVSSLVNFVKGGDVDRTAYDLLRSFILSPLVGGLTGFMVYFVVSAGTSFLVQPAPADPSQAATSNLSAPALAALGVMAGLAAESAIVWLQAKANGFFKSP